MCRSRLWPKPPSRPTGRWRWRCAAAIFAKASPALWKSARRGLRGNERGAWARLRPAGYAAAVFATRGLAQPKQAQPAKAGGARRDRTADLVIANDALSQLSYGPVATASGGPEATDNRRHLQSGPRPSQERCKKSETADFGVILPGTSLVCGGMNRYLADTLPLEPPPHARCPRY